MTRSPLPANTLGLAAALCLLLLKAACAASAPPAERPGDADRADIEALEGAVSRLESRQLEQLERQRELELAVAALIREVQRLGGNAPARGEAPEPNAPQRPDANEIYAVPIDGSPTHGPDDALVTIVKATEFACPFCHRVRPTLAEILEEYGDQVRIVYKHFIVHPQAATIPALAACAAHKQGRHADIEPQIWARGFEQNRDLGEENMKRIARDLGLNLGRFKRDMNGRTCRDRLNADAELLRNVGTSGTPTFFINGRPLIGARPIEHFRELIDAELELAKARVADGTAPADYYQTWVVARGKRSL